MAKLFANSRDPDQMLHMQHLIWVCTVCQLPFYEFPDYNGLNGLRECFQQNWSDYFVFSSLYAAICHQLRLRDMEVISSILIFSPKLLKWALPSLNLDISTAVNRGFSLNSKTEWQTVNPYETAHSELSYQDWHCLHRDLFWSAGLNGERNLICLVDF